MRVWRLVDVAAAAAGPADPEVQPEIDALLARVAELRGGALNDDDIAAAGNAGARAHEPPFLSRRRRVTARARAAACAPVLGGILQYVPRGDGIAGAPAYEDAPMPGAAAGNADGSPVLDGWPPAGAPAPAPSARGGARVRLAEARGASIADKLAAMWPKMCNDPRMKYMQTVGTVPGGATPRQHFIDTGCIWCIACKNWLKVGLYIANGTRHSAASSNGTTTFHARKTEAMDRENASAALRAPRDMGGEGGGLLPHEVPEGSPRGRARDARACDRSGDDGERRRRHRPVRHS